MDDAVQLSADTINTLRAIIHETQTIVNGATVKMRLVQDAYINGTKIPNGNFIYGTASLNNERLKVETNSIRFGNSLYPVKLKAFDLDGLEGICIPGAIANELVKQSSDNALQNIGMMSLDPTLTEQVASAGITAAKPFSVKSKTGKSHCESWLPGTTKKIKYVKKIYETVYHIDLHNSNCNLFDCPTKYSGVEHYNSENYKYYFPGNDNTYGYRNCRYTCTESGTGN